MFNNQWKSSKQSFKKRCVFGLKLSAFALSIGLLSTAYSDTPGMPQAPGAPEAYASEDYSKSHSVDSVTGDMALTLPLFTVPTHGDLEFNIQLTYAAGIQVDQKASEVGLGWSLNQPSFTRAINGIPDDAIEDGTINYHFWKKQPAVYPVHEFEKQIFALNQAKSQAKHKMVKGLVKAAALTALTFGAGAAVSGAGLSAKNEIAKGVVKMKSTYNSRSLMNTTVDTAQSAIKLNRSSATSMSALKKEQDRIREMIDQTTS